MAAENTYVIYGTELLAKGEMANVALDSHKIVLEQSMGRYLLYGTFTGSRFTLIPTRELLVSWNADVPPDTCVEVQVRVLLKGSWSSWMSLGRWSPWLSRAGVWQEPSEEKPYVRGAHVFLPEPCTAVQLQASLYTKDDTKTPALYLLAASARKPAEEKQLGRPLNRSIRVPAYSQLRRAPIFQGKLSGATSLAGMLNRFGCDLLPEELAMLSRDNDPASEGSNAAFSAAASGSFGYPAWLVWSDVADLKQEVRAGNPVMCKVQYAGTPQEETPDLPWMEGVTGTAHGHWLVVRGFTHDEDTGEDTVLVCDPLSGTDYGADRSYRLQDFVRSFAGESLYMRRHSRDIVTWSPARINCDLVPGSIPNTFCLTRRGEKLKMALSRRSDEDAGDVFIPENGILLYTVK